MGVGVGGEGVIRSARGVDGDSNGNSYCESYRESNAKRVNYNGEGTTSVINSEKIIQGEK